MFSFLSQFKHKQEMRDSQDEILVGEMVRVMAHLGNPAIGFKANEGKQTVDFKPVSDLTLYSIRITLDRKSGGSRLSEAILGNKAWVTMQAEIKNFISDPDDLIKMYKTDVKNLLKLPMMGDVKLDHRLNTVVATKQVAIDIDNYLPQDEGGVGKLRQFLSDLILELQEKLEPYKKTA